MGIDGLAGPSEVMIIADDSADPVAMALDLLAQAEHGADSPAVLASDDPEVIEAVAAALADLPEAVGPITLVECASMPLAIELAEAFAPEHLEIATRDPQAIASRITRAGAVFVGRNCATAFGDYVAGSNHVLPTGGAARYASALGPTTFLRRMSVVDMTDEAVEALTPHLAALADAEGFPMHRRSAEAAEAAREPRGRGRAGRRARPTCASAWSWTAPGRPRSSTGVGFFDHMLTLLARHSLIDIEVEARGDLETGSHHTVEDVGITLGQALSTGAGRPGGHRALRLGPGARWTSASRRRRSTSRGARSRPSTCRCPDGGDRRLRDRAARGVHARRSRTTPGSPCTSA